jgi:hypothetical protein
MAEREVMIILPPDIQLVRLREASFVGISGDDCYHHERTARDGHARNLDVLASVALGREIDGRRQTKQLLDSGANQLRVTPQPRKLVRRFCDIGVGSGDRVGSRRCVRAPAAPRPI